MKNTLILPLACLPFDIPVIGTDFFPTFLDFAGIPLIPEQHLDGVSIKPLLEGKKIMPRSLYWKK